MPLRNPPPAQPSDKPTGALYQSTLSRQQAFASIAAITQRLHLTSIWLPAGTVVTSVSFMTSTVALATPTHGWGALYSPSLVLRGQSADDTAIAWAASTTKTFTLAAPYTITADGWHYIGFSVSATTLPTIVCTRPDAPGNNPALVAPAVGGISSTTGLGATAPDPAGAIASSFVPYGYVS